MAVGALPHPPHLHTKLGTSSDDDGHSPSAFIAIKGSAAVGGSPICSLQKIEEWDEATSSTHSSKLRPSSTSTSLNTSDDDVATKVDVTGGSKRKMMMKKEESLFEDDDDVKIIEPQEVLGRGKRMIKPTTVMVDGERVKISNYYEVTAEKYIYMSEKQERVDRKKLFTQAASFVKRVIPKHPVAERKVFPMLQALRARNAIIDQDKEGIIIRRNRFFRRYLEELRPFLSAKVLARLEATPPPLGPLEVPILSTQPACITGGEMRDYQLLGLRWLITHHDAGINSILGDEMGLGKTLQTIAFLAYLKFERKLEGPSLVVCPLSVLSSWMAECRRWCPELRVVQLHTSDMEERKRQCKEILPAGDYDICVTTFDMVKNKICRHLLVQTVHWRYLVLDEGHIIKNETSDIAQTVRRMHFGNVLLLTGTPLQNNLHELYALLNFMCPDVFENSEVFDQCFDLTHHKVDPAMLGKAHHLLKPFMLRRLKADVEKGLPPRIETRIYCPLSGMQSFWYKRLLLKEEEAVNRLEKNEKNTASDWRKLQMLLMQLRKCANHPFLFPGAEADPLNTTTDDLVEASGKLQTLDRLLVKLHAKGHRVVIFSQWTHTLDIIHDFLEGRGYRFCRLDGGTNRIRRIINIDAFNAPDSPLFAFLMTTRAGGLGVNLQTADTVILFDSDWNPQPDLQAMARVHRIGQTKVVHVYRFVCDGTIETRVCDHAEKKLYLAEHVNRDSVALAQGGGEDGDVPDEVDKQGLLNDLKFGSDAVAITEGNQLLDDEVLDAIIDRTRKGNEAVGKIQSCKKSLATFDAARQLTSTRMLQGVQYEKPRSIGDISSEWAAVQAKRESQKRIKMVEGAGTGYGGMIPVLHNNDYRWEEPSVFQRELKGRGAGCKDVKKQLLLAYRDYTHDEYCQNCWDGGNLVCCDHCPAVYHLACLGYKKKKDIPSNFSCPQHRCAQCHRNAPAAGGVIFRCLGCPNSFCYDHKPGAADILAHNPRFEALGYPDNAFTCFVYCSPECKEWGQAIKLLGPPSGARYEMEK